MVLQFCTYSKLTNKRKIKPIQLHIYKTIFLTSVSPGAHPLGQLTFSITCNTQGPFVELYGVVDEMCDDLHGNDLQSNRQVRNRFN